MGTVVISVDAALGWSCIDRQSPPVERVEAARSGWRTLLDRFDDHDLPATWGVVGHLLLEHCDGVHEHHPLSPGWFDREREAWEDCPELRFAPNLVEETVDAPAGHEFAFMPFSHVEFGHDEVSSDLARAECVGFFDALPDDLPSPRTATFPCNAVGHRAVLAEWGFECYRGRIPGRATQLPIARSARRLANATVAGPPIVRPTVDEYGLVALPTSLDCSAAQSAAGRLYSRAITDPTLAAVHRGLERVAASDDGVFHCRLRPIDVIDDRDESRLESFCRAVADYRDDEGVDVATVGTVAERARSAPPSRWSHPMT
ncbi:Polysaccharide deacetylase [Salinarchaeum sp. Harcht-Bsk1]|uniref:polysaccharide deacetylase n=1 Tax=Salinarchaeum sp. Harcht-Bsk1 TaxID=1333523 RepID=UPI0003423CF6|nr:polysaccharide deacetylase [Salinarchaeum sp. Harcht-Bsk1]AGN02214.1 Polysaccharide deacetylase [Salinarchaeum sp. Harcht-Bsk1]